MKIMGTYRHKKQIRWIVTEKGCWEVYTHAITRGGYIKLSFRGKYQMLHRLAYELFNGPIRKGKFICHSCDNPACINPDHLFEGTQNDNMADASSKGRMRQKLEKNDVLAIRDSYVSAKTLAEKYGVSKSMIYAIWQGRLWKQVGGKIRKGPGQGWHGDSDGHKKSADVRWCP